MLKLHLVKTIKIKFWFYYIRLNYNIIYKSKINNLNKEFTYIQI